MSCRMLRASKIGRQTRSCSGEGRIFCWSITAILADRIPAHVAVVNLQPDCSVDRKEDTRRISTFCPTELQGNAIHQGAQIRGVLSGGVQALYD